MSTNTTTADVTIAAGSLRGGRWTGWPPSKAFAMRHRPFVSFAGDRRSRWNLGRGSATASSSEVIAFKLPATLRRSGPSHLGTASTSTSGPPATPFGRRVAVLVWIHGGGYVGGGSSVPVYDATAFAQRGIVAVTFNYRLGRFGFFAHPAVVANAAGGRFGNYGYMDQIWALEWVRDNISAFGGNPDRVTIVGESAGGESVIQLLTSPAVDDGLLSGAMVMSGGGRKSLFNRPLREGSLFNLADTPRGPEPQRLQRHGHWTLGPGFRHRPPSDMYARALSPSDWSAPVEPQRGSECCLNPRAVGAWRHTWFVT